MSLQAIDDNRVYCGRRHHDIETDVCLSCQQYRGVQRRSIAEYVVCEDVRRRLEPVGLLSWMGPGRIVNVRA